MRMALRSMSACSSSSLSSRPTTAWASGHVARGDGVDAVGDLGLGQAAHARDLGLELVQLLAVDFSVCSFIVIMVTTRCRRLDLPARIEGPLTLLRDCCRRMTIR